MAYINGKETMFSSTYSVLDPIVVQEVGDSETNVMSQKAVKDYIETRVFPNIDRNSNRISNLEARLADDIFIVDSEAAHKKIVPLNVAPYAAIKKVCGMTYRDEATNTLKSAKVKALRSEGKNLANARGWSASSVYSDSDNLALTNAYGTTLSTTEGSVITITQQQYPNTSSPSDYNNGYFVYALTNQLNEGETYRLSVDIMVKANPLSIDNIYFMANGVYQGSGRLYVSGNAKQRVNATFTWIKNDTRRDVKYIEFRCGGASFEIGNVMITRADVEDTTYTPYGTIDTFAIPEKVQTECDGYGDGISADYHNYFEYTEDGRVLYHDNVYEYTYSTSDLVSAAHISGHTTYRYYISSYNVGLQGRLYGSQYQTQDISVSDRFTVANYGDDKVGYYLDTGGSAIYIKSPYSTVEETKKWLNGAKFILARAEPIVTDITDLITPDNFIEVQGGDFIVAVNAHNLAACTEIIYQKEI